MASPRLCLITGGNTGIGFEVARQLLQRGHEVIIACRDDSRAKAACERLQAAAASSSSSVSAVRCDLASLASVRECAQQVAAKWPRLDLLVCNAAIITAQPTLTGDGFDTMYQVNHLGHFLLSHLLLPQLLNSDAARLVVVGSQQYSTVPLELADPLFFHKLAAQQQQQQQQQQGTAAAAAASATAMQRYSLTKLYNLWFTKHMAAAVLPQLEHSNDNGSSSSRRLVVNAVTPGFVPTTELSRYAGPLGRFAMKHIISWAPFAVTEQEAASRVAAVCDGAAEGESCGQLYSRRAVADTSAGPAGDAEAAAALWQQSCMDVGIQQYLPQ
ncbi:hypothetical protein OEZ85_013521 [Tetradesmus obliquus]|uniref:Protochlorophyllide reductase n=1 Tax=Tetradesmus obliquus TaxID=3088 RepID=A0ABY8UU22_TETOB|nr:hypothetical protein OEZ85_013521 [Tetradesmus obliquus]